jgi:hypothetical protein
MPEKDRALRAGVAGWLPLALAEPHLPGEPCLHLEVLKIAWRPEPDSTSDLGASDHAGGCPLNPSTGDLRSGRRRQDTSEVTRQQVHCI